jgi:hypothetical protein
MLRIDFKHDRKIPSQLGHCAKGSLKLFFCTAVSFNEGIPGMFVLMNTPGAYAGVHPNLHAIAAAGLFRPNGAFHSMSKRDAQQTLGITVSPSLRRSWCLARSWNSDLAGLHNGNDLEVLTF